jgi:hypothetical protein
VPLTISAEISSADEPDLKRITARERFSAGPSVLGPLNDDWHREAGRHRPNDQLAPTTKAGGRIFARATATIASAAFAATLLAGCGRDHIAAQFPDGSCVVFSEDTLGDNAEIRNAECSGPHTHIVVAWKSGRNAQCPDGADAFFDTTDGRLCLRPDPSPSTSP